MKAPFEQNIAWHLPCGTDLEGIKGSWKAAEAWHCERQEEVIGEGAVSVVVKNLEQ